MGRKVMHILCFGAQAIKDTKRRMQPFTSCVRRTIVAMFEKQTMLPFLASVTSAPSCAFVPHVACARFVHKIPLFVCVCYN